jgi:hypothetical protein
MPPVVVMRPHLAGNRHLVFHSLAGRTTFALQLERIVDYLFGVLYVALLVRLALEFFGAHESGFVAFVRGVTRVFYDPFRGMFATTTVDGQHFLVWPLIVALLAYMVLHAVVRALLRTMMR